MIVWYLLANLIATLWVIEELRNNKKLQEEIDEEFSISEKFNLEMISQYGSFYNVMMLLFGTLIMIPVAIHVFVIER